MCCVSAQVGKGKYGDIYCYGHALDGRELVIKLVPDSNDNAVRRLQWEAGMLLQAQPAVGRTLPRPLHWAIDNRVRCALSVHMCLCVHCMSPAWACHMHAAARCNRAALLAVLCSMQHFDKRLEAVSIAADHTRVRTCTRRACHMCHMPDQTGGAASALLVLPVHEWVGAREVHCAS
jgi:hypothetical protein